MRKNDKETITGLITDNHKKYFNFVSKYLGDEDKAIRKEP